MKHKKLIKDGNWYCIPISKDFRFGKGSNHIEGRDDDILVGERFSDKRIINSETQSKILIANDNSKITLRFPQLKMMNHH